MQRLPALKSLLHRDRPRRLTPAELEQRRLEHARLVEEMG